MALTPDQLVAKSATEHSIQVAFFAWMALEKHPDMKWVHAVPNGGERNAVVAGRMKAEGARTGIWDVFVPVRRGDTRGMYIEFKRPEHRARKNGGLSDAQLAFGAYAHSQGYRMKVAYTWREAAIALCGYLGTPYVEMWPENA